MAIIAYQIGLVAGSSEQALGNDAGSFTLRTSGLAKVGQSGGGSGFPLRPEDGPFTIVLEAGESIFGIAPVTATQPSGTDVTVFVFKNDT